MEEGYFSCFTEKYCVENMGLKKWEGKSNKIDSLLAVNMFTDREEPQEAFERKINVVKNYFPCEPCVLNYYGIGGIGKTLLLNRFCHILDNNGMINRKTDYDISCDYICYDFDSMSKDKKDIINSFYVQLKKINNDFKFFLYEYARETYIEKSGVKLDGVDEIEKGDNLFLETTADIVSTAIPIVSSVYSILKAARKYSESGIEWFREHENRKRYQACLNRIKGSTISEILNDIPLYFAMDMECNMCGVAKRPVIVFLDTYEKYVNVGSNDNVPIFIDSWLRKGENSLIQLIPGFMWVIMGREKLNWDIDEPLYWNINKNLSDIPLGNLTIQQKNMLAEEKLEYHLLGDLSQKDSMYFLEQMGCYDKKIRNYIYSITNGTPLFLDICVKQYNRLISMGMVPKESDFGGDLNELINRYLSDMPSYQREMAYFLSCFNRWTDSEIQELAERIDVLMEYSNSRYYEFIRHSFVNTDIDGSHYLHETFRKACQENADGILKEKTYSELLSYLKNFIFKLNDLSISYYIENYISTLFSKYNANCNEDDYIPIREAFNKIEHMGNYKEQLRLGIFLVNYTKHTEYDKRGQLILVNGYLNNGFYKEGMKLAEAVYEEVKNLNDESLLKIDTAYCLAKAYRRMGLPKKANEKSFYAYSQRLKLFGNRHIDTLDALECYAIDCYALGEYKKALEMTEYVYNTRRELCGECHPDTLRDLCNIASIYTSLGEYKKAYDIHLKVYNVRKTLLGEYHPDTILSLIGIAYVMDYLGNCKKALEIYESVYELRKEALGLEHPSTLEALNQVAFTNSKLGNYEKALELEQKVYEKRNDILGSTHSSTLRSLNAMALINVDLKKYKIALELYSKAYETAKETLGEKSTLAIAVLNNIAVLYRQMGNYDKALERHKIVYNYYKEKYGERHPRTLVYYSALGNDYIAKENYEQALRIHKYVYEERTKLVGLKHRLTIKSCISIAECYMHMNMVNQALNILERAHEVSVEVVGSTSMENKRILKLIDECKKSLQ